MYKRKKVWLSVIVIATFLIYASCLFYAIVPHGRYVNATVLAALNSDGVNNLMIVAHPDDESLWGGSALISENYLVVCVTNGGNKVRKKEFMNAMKFTGDVGLMLKYRDKYNKTWGNSSSLLKSDLTDVILYKNWDKIVTHNPNGEYGHLHHKKISSYITAICKAKNKKAELYYFSPYYSTEELPIIQNSLISLDLTAYQKKCELLNLFPSQKSIIDRHAHMMRYESLYPAFS